MTRRGRRFAFLLGCSICWAAPAQAQTARDANEAWIRGDLPVAERLYLQVLEADSTDGSALHRLALVRAWADRHDESLAYFDRLFRYEPRNWDARVDRARVLAWRGDQTGAAAALDSVLAAQPRFVPALIARAQIVSWQGALDEALETYGRALAVNPANREARAGRARVLSWAADFEGAAATFDSLVHTDPRDLEAWVGLGNVLLIAERLEAARAAFMQALTLDPENQDALAGLARVSAFAGDLKGAELQWRRLIEVAPGNTDARVGLATAMRWAGREASAVAVLEEALRGEPGHGEARGQLRQAQIALGSAARPVLVHESDSDENRISSFSVGAGVRVRPRLELGAEAYARTADYAVAGASAQAFGGAATMRLQTEPGWEVAAALGASTSDVEDAGLVPSARASFTTSGMVPWRASLQASYSALDATWALMLRRVAVGEVTLTTWGSLGRWRASVGASAASFRGRVSGENNRRLGGTASLWRRFGSQWTLGASGRAFAFQENVQDGYFDPSFYGIGELPIQWGGHSGKWTVEALLAPGLQHIGGGASTSATARGSVGVTHAFTPGREVALVTTYSAAGVNQLTALDASDYNYFSIALRGSFAVPYTR